MATIQMCLGALDRIMPTSSSLKNTNRLLGCDEVSLNLAKSLRSKTSRNRVRAHRKRLRQQGLRPIRIWVPGCDQRLWRQKSTVSLSPSQGARTPRRIRTLSMLSLTGHKLKHAEIWIVAGGKGQLTSRL